MVGSDRVFGPDVVQLWVIFNDIPMASYLLGKVSSFR